MNHTSRRWLISLILALIMTLSISSAMAATGTVNVASLVLREEASTNSDALQTLSKGEELEIIYKDGSWYKVKYGRYTGYVMTRYVKVSGDVASKDEVESLRIGSRGDAVKEVQKRLKELGYLTGSADGVFGEKTADAVKAFQKRNGLTADGVVGESTLKKLESSSAKKAETSSSSGSSSSSKVDEDDTLRYGDQGEAIKNLQKRLKELGYYNSTIDGQFGSGTLKAVKAFQARNGLTQDGAVGESTLKKLNSSSAKKATDDADEKTEADEDDGTLRQGSKGTAVKTLQQKLKDLGYYKSSVDGVYGSGTIAAVKAFQTRNKLTVDGVAGTSTLKVLYSASAKAAEDEEKEDEKEEDTTLRAGSYGNEVKKVQERLKELGYYKNSIDGSYGSLTVAAVKAFQQRNGLTVDGVCGSSTLSKLNSSSAKAAADAEDDDDDKNESSNSSDETLRPGSSGTAVKELQYRLKELGYYTGSRDGVYGTQTRTAVMSFQTRNGLTVDGIAGPATLKKLYSSSAVKASNSSSGSSGSSGSGSSSSGGSSSGGAVTAASLKTNQTLKPGDKNDQVKALQYRLNELGYYDNTFDGDYGYGTRQAVLAFQKNNGLTQDGIAGETTLKKMVSSSAVGKNDVQAGTYVTERLDWFNGGASRIPRGAIFQVKDVKTGLTFTAKRQAGAYHLDAEPLTAADTAILKKINGGEFSYRRRPMLVLYNGRVYACSIYSEPHGEDTIASNNFEGQFCLHFYGSKTHGTDRVDEDHQDCEAEALKATW